MKKLKNYFFNLEKKYTKTGVFANWLTILLPLTFYLLLALFWLLFPDPEQAYGTNTGVVFGGCFIAWFIILIWMIVYKIRRKIRGVKLSLQKKKQI